MFGSASGAESGAAHELDDIDEERAALVQPSVWLELSQLMMASRLENGGQFENVINTGQGFPDWPSPEFVRQAAADIFLDAANAPRTSVYSPTRGITPFLSALCAEYGPRIKQKLDPQRNVCVTVGASQAIQLCMQAFLNRGDEVVLIEPFFDLYRAAAMLSHATIRSVALQLRSPPASAQRQSNACDFVLDMAAFESCFNENTRVLVLNSPHNPTGKMFSRDEYSAIMRVLRKFPKVTVVSDEVYEHITFDDHEHVPFASISEEAFARTVSIYSAGKTFSCTGWKVGWLIAPPALISRAALIQQWIVFSVCTPLQAALANIISRAREPYEGHENYYAWLKAEYTRKRDIQVRMLAGASLRPVVPMGAFFVMADTARVESSMELHTLPPRVAELEKQGLVTIDASTRARRDYNLVRRLILEYGVSAVPPSAFYAEANHEQGANLLRFSFCRSDGALLEAGQRLQKLFE
ncbi:Kynurenine--oxoglutarate transaminase [Porphyridium purpureum]|uniref:Kynurenine--oxoglutarate transaminase n=1 Tax=Porphyridium purpureum TaxID=35688 RepID=A0A5J4Z9D6_PORPP|nr:Kynurenine--oxoglutarate transaminase [Porphyridium purpureum]|eukprot:POR7156..scf295_1